MSYFKNAIIISAKQIFKYTIFLVSSGHDDLEAFSVTSSLPEMKQSGVTFDEIGGTNILVNYQTRAYA